MRDSNSEAQEHSRFHRSVNELIERLTPGIFEYKYALLVVLGQSHRPKRPCCVQFVSERIFVLQLFNGFERGAW
jgi:hypothetical protein